VVAVLSGSLELRAAAIRGHVRFQNRPLPGVIVMADGSTDEKPVTAMATTDKNGYYAIPGLPNGEYSIGGSHTNYGFEPIEITLGADTNVDLAGFQVFSVSGTVRNASAGLANVQIAALGASFDFTDDDGNYTLTGLRPGSYTVAAELEGYVFHTASNSVTVTIKHLRGVDFAAEPILFAVGGRITQNGYPLSGVTVGVGSLRTNRVTLTDSEGVYIVSGLEADSYFAIPALVGYSFAPPGRSILLGADIANTNFRATGAYSIGGTVTNGNTKVTVGLWIGTNHVQSAQCDPDGKYTITVGSGTYSLALSLSNDVLDPAQKRTVSVPPNLLNADFTAPANLALPGPGQKQQ